MVKRCLLMIIVLLTLSTAYTQTDTTRPLKIGILTPLYIDSAFNGYEYKLGPNSIPKYILPGLEFYNGAVMAVEQLQKENAHIDVSVFDTKKNKVETDLLLKELQRTGFDLLIGSFNNSTEQALFADFATENNIPLISATYPNDAQLKADPFFVMLNPTIQTHIAGIYKYVLNNLNNNANILFVTKKGSFEDRIRKQFSDLNKSKSIKYKMVELNDYATAADLDLHLDSTRHNVIITGSLNENFSVNLVQRLSELMNYRTSIVGMPNWDGMRSLDRIKADHLEIIYSTPYNYYQATSIGTSIHEVYKAKYYSRPSDMAFKGYESMYRFSKLLVKHRNDLINGLSDPAFNVWNSFSFEPVKLSPDAVVPDYLENKRLYFVKKVNGQVKAVQ